MSGIARMPSTARLALALSMLPAAAEAHSFGRSYVLPVPLWMYQYGAMAALLLSFLVAAWFLSARKMEARAFRRFAVPGVANRLLLAPAVVAALRWICAGLLMLAILSGLIGTPDPYANFNTTFFWVVFVLIYAYAIAIFGDSYSELNPWRLLVPQRWTGRRPYPEHWSCGPALVLYMLFIWIELFGQLGPRGLSVGLIGYATIGLAWSWWWGLDAWLKHGEFFAVMFRLLSRIAPFERVQNQIHLRPPFVGLLDERCESLPVLLFVLFMLSSTTFDGLHQSVAWLRFFLQNLAQLWEPEQTRQHWALVKMAYAAHQSLVLVVSPFLYLLLYAACVYLAKLLTRSQRSLKSLCLDFGYSLLPIALAYHVTHYYTLAITQAPVTLRLLSDPFGFGWNLFGTASWFKRAILLDAGWIWHTQVALILGGHVVSVVLAHIVAVRIFPTKRQTLLSQLPMLALMMAYTLAGLWVLSLPLQAGSMMAP